MRRGAALGITMATVVAGLALLAATAGAAFDCGAYVERCQASIDNTGRVWFTTPDVLTEDALGDGSVRHGVFQIYERTAETTRLASIGPDGNPIPADTHRSSGWLNGVSPDGSRVYITTAASLAPEDADDGLSDASTDSYELTSGAYRLLTTGPLDQPSTAPFTDTGATILWASDDGRYVYFLTNRRMTPEDLDDSADVYARADGQTRLVSTGPAIPPPDPAFVNPPVPQAWFLGASTDGATAYFTTPERLTADDPENSTSDIFAWSNGVTRRVTRTVKGSEGPGAVWEAFGGSSFGGAASDGSFFFLAFSPQAADDTDPYEDLYAARPDGSLQRLTSTPVGPGLDSGAARFLRPGAASRDGSRVFFITARPFVAEDTDGTLDVYMWSPEGIRLVTPGLSGNPAGNAEEVHLNAISRDGRRAYFTTYEQLDPADTDDKADVYEWADGPVRLVSPASDGRQAYAFFRGISPNGRYIAFATFEPLLGADNDADEDIYLVDMGAGTAVASSSRASRGRPRGKRVRRKLRLVTAESIPPRMRIAPRGRFSARRARLRLRCPRVERSGPCRGRATLLAGRRRTIVARGSFRIAPGRARVVVLAGKGLPRRGHRTLRLRARVRSADRLGNAAVVSARVRLRRGSSRRR